MECKNYLSAWLLETPETIFSLRLDSQIVTNVGQLSGRRLGNGDGRLFHASLENSNH